MNSLYFIKYKFNKINKNYLIFFVLLVYFFIFKFIIIIYGDWGLGIGDWGLGIGPNPQSPIPNPQSPIPIIILIIFTNNNYLIVLN